MVTYMIEGRDKAGKWINWQSVNATNPRAARMCFERWLRQWTAEFRINFRLVSRSTVDRVLVGAAA